MVSMRRRWIRLSLALGLRAVRHPRIAADLLGVAWRFRSRNWWRKPPFLPLPDSEYLRWRMHTAYGDHDAIPPADDVVRYAKWSREQS